MEQEGSGGERGREREGGSDRMGKEGGAWEMTRNEKGRGDNRNGEVHNLRGERWRN